ncbi:MAG: hypothetical protein ACI4WG_06255 [Erysipelotrichaceae bacterium]
MENKKHVVVSKGNMKDISLIDMNDWERTTIMYKMSLPTYLFGMAFIFFILMWNTVTLIIGVIFIIAMSVAYFSVPNQKIMDITEKRIIIYDTGEEGKVIEIPIEELDSYSYGELEEGINIIKLRTISKDLIYCETYQSSKAMGALKKIAPEKELIDKEKAKINKRNKKNNND